MDEQQGEILEDGYYQESEVRDDIAGQPSFPWFGRSTSQAESGPSEGQTSLVAFFNSREFWITATAIVVAIVVLWAITRAGGEHEHGTASNEVQGSAAK